MPHATNHEAPARRDARTGPTDTFARRHIGPREDDVRAMLDTLGLPSLDALVQQTVPQDILREQPLRLPDPRSEHEVLRELQAIAQRNEPARSYLGMGYHDCLVPPVIQRNILENPGWYTQYTPYQAEISQGRLQALLNYQTMVADLTGLPLANASLLDEGTAAAEAMHMCFAAAKGDRHAFFVADDCHPQTIEVVRTRAWPLGIQVLVGDPLQADAELARCSGVLVQYPATDGRVRDFAALAQRAHQHGALLVVATDLLALCLLRPPGEFGADVALGSSQRFGVPLGAGGPHAAFLATRDEHKRQLPGRLIGVAVDAAGKPALRMALQTREQHIRRDKATSNICTAQVLLAIMAGMYAVYHGPQGLRAIAQRVQALTALLACGLRRLSARVQDGPWFDTLKVWPARPDSTAVLRRCRERRMNLRAYDGGALGISLDEAATEADVAALLECFTPDGHLPFSLDDLWSDVQPHLQLPPPMARAGSYLTHPVFHRYHAEHELLRYITRLQSKDLSLAHSMIPLGSCTMKLNATTEMVPITWPQFAQVHPFAPAEQQQGYAVLYEQLERWLGEITGFPGVSLQPNAGSQGEYTGLLVIRAWHAHRDQPQRNVCLIPTSAHGTNPASAVMAGMRVVTVACDERGNIDVGDLRAKAAEHRQQLAALMITYPSTHGVFEEQVREICRVVHEHGGQVYMDGANMNAQVGLTRPADIGADVCHLNLHKTFCIPHGGGGPGMGPIGVAEHLVPFLPGHPMAWRKGAQAIGPVASAPYGSASILPISWAYIAMMGAAGLRRATEIAILNANYMAHRLAPHYPVLYTGARGRVAHEFILDCRPVKVSADVSAEDIAKRLMDFGFHAPTMSFPVAGTLMIEPTESESREELDRFCDALIAIREEIRAIEQGRLPRDDNPLHNAPHTVEAVSADEWTHPYPRSQAAFPVPWLHERKFWPSVARIDNAYGDRHLVCTCPPVESFAP